MNQRIHDSEADTNERVVRSLLAAQCPEIAHLPLTFVDTSGTDNAMWRVGSPDGSDLVVRLPRIPAAARSLAKEVTLVLELAEHRAELPFAIPTVRLNGEPTSEFPHRWTVLEWLDGVDAWTGRSEIDHGSEALALDLAAAIRKIGSLHGITAPKRRPGDRGGPIEPLLADLEQWLTDPEWSASDLVDVTAIRRSADEVREAVTGSDITVETRLVHGDLIAGNLLVEASRLTAVIDWGGAAYADPAQDLAPAWSILDRRGRRVFREAVGADDVMWLRARAFELQHAVAAVVYYTPRRHPLADVMARTLLRILDDV